MYLTCTLVIAIEWIVRVLCVAGWSILWRPRSTPLRWRTLTWPSWTDTRSLTRETRLLSDVARWVRSTWRTQPRNHVTTGDQLLVDRCVTVNFSFLSNMAISDSWVSTVVVLCGDWVYAAALAGIRYHCSQLLKQKIWLSPMFSTIDLFLFLFFWGIFLLYITKAAY